MGLTDHLKREKPLKVIPSATEEEPELMPMPALAYKNGREKTVPVIVAPIAPVKEREKEEWKKPPGMSQEDWIAAISVFSPQRVNEIYQDFDPKAVEPFYEQLYKKVHRQVEEPDEKRIRSARNVAALGDALSLIAQSVGAAKGSFIDLRNDSASRRTDAGIERLKEAYRRDRAAYDGGAWEAMIRDVEGGRNAYNRDRAALLSYLAALRKAKSQEKKFNGEMVYRYEKMKQDEAARKDQAKQQAARLALDWHKAKGKGSGSGLKYMDFYNPITGISYRVEQNKWKANYTQIYDRIKHELYKEYPRLQNAERWVELKPEQKEEFVKQYMYQNPEALKFLDDIAELKYQDGVPEKPKLELPPLSEEQVKMIQDIVQKNQKDERQALLKTMQYLKEQGFSREQVNAVIRTIKTD